MSVASQFAKQAENELSQLKDLAPNMLRSQANSDITKVLLTSLGVGAAARGGLGLARMLHGNLASSPPRTLGPAVARLPSTPDDEEEKYASFLDGGDSSSKTGIPYYMPGLALSAGAGLAGGWAGIDKLLDSRRKAQQEEKLQTARQEFEQALATQPGVKLASTSVGNRLGMELDLLFDTLEKNAGIVSDFLGPGMADAAGKLAGGYGTYAGVSGLGAAYLAHSFAKKQQRRAVFEKAQQRRISDRESRRPSEIYAVTSPRQSPNTAEHREDLKADDDTEN